MSFTGKATYSAGTTLPELAEDVSDLIGIVSPYETPLLDALGDPLRAATSTHHEWLEDELLPNKDAVDDDSIADPDGDTQFDVANGSRFRVGDQIQVEASAELMLVTAISTDTLTVVRGYAGTTAEDLVDEQVIIGGDILVAINGTRITGIDDMSAYLEEYTLPGQTVNLTVVRGNETIFVPLELGSRPATTSAT